jgi:transcriptional regulator with XRE-family HTH domain
MAVVSRLKQLMEERNLSQAEVARSTGLSPTIIGKLYHNSFRRIDLNTTNILRDFFEVRSLSELFEFDDV